MDLVEAGTLDAMVKARPNEGRGLPRDVVALFVVQMTLALRHMHKKGIMYRDLKPANVLLSKTGHIKLCDFGLAGRINTPKERMLSSTLNNISGADSECHVSKSPIPFIDPAIAAEYESTEAEQILPISPAKNPPQRDASEKKEEICESVPEKSGTISLSISGKDEVSNTQNTDTDEAGKGDAFKEIEYVGRPVPSSADPITRKTTCGTAGYRAPEQVRERNIKYNKRGGYDESTDWFSLGTTCYVLLCGKKPFKTKAEIAKALADGEYDNLTRDEDFGSQVIPTNSKNDFEIKALMLKVSYPDFIEEDPKNFVESLMMRDSNKRLNYNGVKCHPT